MSKNNHSLPIVFLPGMMLDQRLWQFIMDALSEKYPCYFVDSLGCDSLASMLDRIYQLQLSAFQLFGFSMGGYVATEYALKFPEQIKKLAIIGYSPDGFSESKQQQIQYQLNHLPDGPYTGMRLSQMRQFVHPSQLENREVIELLQSMTRDAGIINYQKQQSATLRRQNRVQALAALECPVLFVAGDADQQVNLDDVKRVDQALSRCILKIIPECGHFIPLEKPHALLKILEYFLTV